MLLATLARPAWADGKWQRLGQEDGILLEIREIPGQDFPELRGTTVMPVNSWQVLSVIADLNRTCLWTARCAESKELSRTSEFDRLFYSRTSAPFPVSHRDGVLHGMFVGDLAQGTDMAIKFDSVASPLMPARDGVVRMTTLRGHYRIWAIDEHSSRVEFVVHADPMGWLPTWLVRRMATGVPRDTLAGLRKQAVKMIGKYDDQIQRWRGQAGAN